MTFKTEKDLKKIITLADNNLKKAVVVGAGAIGIELAQALNDRKIETHLVEMGDHVLPNMLDDEMVQEAQESIIKSGIHLHLRTKVTALHGKTEVEKVEFADSTGIDFSDTDIYGQNPNAQLNSLVVFAVGMTPNIDIFLDTNLATGKDGIIVNNKMETNISDVYAVGDVCQFTSGISDEILSGKLATNAVPMGRILAKNLTGGNETYPGFFNGAATKINDFFLGSSGFTEKKANSSYEIVVGNAEFTTAFPIMPFAKKVKVKLIADKKTGTLLGGQVVSGVPVADKIDQITMAIQYKIPLTQLVNLSYSSQPYQSFYPAHNLIVKATEDILSQMN